MRLPSVPVKATCKLPLSGVIADGTSGGTVAVVKTGVGGWMLTGNNTYSGGTQINAGNIEITNPGALGSGTVNVAAVHSWPLI